MTTYNATGSVLTATATLPSYVVFIITFLVLGAILFMAFKYFRFLCYGLAVLVPTGLLIWVSSGVTNQVKQGDTFSFYVILGTLGVIIVSVLIGYLLSKTQIVKGIEEKLSNEEGETK